MLSWVGRRVVSQGSDQPEMIISHNGKKNEAPIASAEALPLIPVAFR